MLSEIQKNKFTVRAKAEALKLLKEMQVEEFTSLDDSGNLIELLDCKISSLVTMKESENLEIDEELLEIYDLLQDIVLDNEEDLNFLNQLFFDKV